VNDAAALPRHPALISGSVMIAALLFSIDWTIAVVALPHMQGAFSAAPDQISWVITSYIVASAIMIPTAGWMSSRFGRKRVFVWAMAGFTIASLFCGLADSLAFEVFSRLIQGLCGAFIIPLSQAITLDTYPPEQHGRAMALWGTGAVCGSMLGPTIGGYVTEYLSWRYIFFLNIPFGIIAWLGILSFVPETVKNPKHRLDWFGFLALALCLGSLQMMLDRGVRLDWFESGEIIIEACLCVLGFYLFIAHSLTTKAPFLDLHLFTQRGFFFALAFAFGYGLLTLPTMVLMPTFLADIRGYSIDDIGLLQSPRGIGMFSAMLISGRIVNRISPRTLIAIGLVSLAISSAEMATWNLQVDEWSIVWTGFLQGLGAGIMLVPTQVLAFSPLPAHQRTEATGVFNMVRNVGASVGVSLAFAYFVHVSAVHHAQMVERVTPYHAALQTENVRQYWDITTPEGQAKIEKEIARQAAMFGYTADFALLAAGAVLGFPILFLMGNRKQRTTGSKAEETTPLMIVE
jgi:MFS transporter, DHA2 family, multidrug resistance protein